MHKVRVTTTHITNGRQAVKVIDHDDFEDRKWLGKHCFWAMRNGLSVETRPDDAQKTRSLILDAVNSYAEHEAARKSLVDAREAFLGMVADATVWEEDVDGDIDGVSIDYRIHTPGFSFEQLTEALGIEPKWTEGLKACIDRLVDEPPVSSLNEEGKDK